MRNSLLDGLTPRQFLSRHWQKKPLLVRQAIPDFQGPLSRAAVLRLARSAELETRLVARRGAHWSLSRGPFARNMLAALPDRSWTLLVQGLNHALAAADELLQRFDFISQARLDDVMVSFAVPGGGVGPHLDSYDVFLLQGAGRRRWRIGMPHDPELDPGQPLKVLRHFRRNREWDQEFVLEPGDMLYLPPGTAHEGVALTECFTYSIGFRAPAYQELGMRFLYYLQDRIALAGRYEDAGLRPTKAPGKIPRAMLDGTGRALSRIRWNSADVADFLGRDLTEPKAHVVFSPPARPLGVIQFATALKKHGIALDPRSLMLYDGRRLFLNGDTVELVAGAAGHLRRLADRRRLGAAELPAPLRTLLRSWYLSGFVHIDSESRNIRDP